MPAERVRRYLLEHGVPYEADSHPVAFTAREIARVEGIPDSQMAKAVLLKTDDQLVMVVVPGDRQVDLDKARLALSAETVRLATESEFTPLFPDCETGAEPPFGALYDVATIVDSDLKSSRITFNAGSHADVISMALADYLQLTHPRMVDVAS